MPGPPSWSTGREASSSHFLSRVAQSIKKLAVSANRRLRPPDDTTDQHNTTISEVQTALHTRTTAQLLAEATNQRKKMQQGRRKSRPRIAGVRLGPSSPSRRGGSSGGAGRRLRLPVQLAQGPRSRKRAEGKRALTRSASEPALWWHDSRVHPVTHPPSPPPPPLERPHTCYDVLAPDSPFAGSSSSSLLLPPDRRTPWEEAKVVVNVTVEGSAGPVRAMVSLGSSVRDAIAAVVERYHREGRSPRLDPASAESFQLHHSHFSLQSLNKNDKIGDVGGRNFYLHKNDGSNGLALQRGEPGVHSGGGETTQSHGGQLAPYHHQLLAIVMKKLDKIGRRTKRIWRLLTCNCT